MEKTKLTLCQDCCCCPEIEVVNEKGDVVIRDDDGGSVKLPKTAWNALVSFVKDGKLKELA